MKKKLKSLSRKGKVIIISAIAVLGVGIIIGGSLIGMNVYQQAEQEKKIALAEEKLEKDFQGKKDSYNEMILKFENSKQYLNDEENKGLAEIKEKTSDISKKNIAVLDKVLLEIEELKTNILLRHETEVNARVDSFVLLDGFNEENSQNSRNANQRCY